MRHRFNCHYYYALKLNDLFQFFSEFFIYFSLSPNSQRDAREKNCSIGLSLNLVSQTKMIGNVCALRNLKRQSNR